MWLSLLATAALAAPRPCGTPWMAPLGPLRAPPAASLDGALVERDATGTYPHALSSEHFIVKWGDTGEVTEDEVRALLAAFEDGWVTEVLEMEHPAPPGADTYYFNVYLGDTGSGTPRSYGSAGYYNTDGDGYPMIVVARETLYDPDYTAITAVHEFYHAVQHGLGTYAYSGSAAWYWEATAEWVSAYVYPDNPDTAVFLFSFAYLPYLPVNYFNYPDAGTLDEYHQYGAFIFPRYLSEHAADWALVRDSWVLGGDSDPLVVLAGLLEARGLAFDDVFTAFVAHNAAWDYADRDVYLYYMDYYSEWYYEEDFRVADEIPARGTDGWVAADKDTLPQRYGANVLRLESPPAGEVTLRFQGEPLGSQGSAASFGVTAVVRDGAGVTYTRMPLTDQAGALTLSLSGEEEALYLSVAAWTDEEQSGETFDYAWGAEIASPAEGEGEGEGEKAVGCACGAAGAAGRGGAALALLYALGRARVSTRTPAPSSKRRSASTKG